MPLSIEKLRALGAKGQYADAGLLNKSDMRKWRRYWESRGHSTQVDKVHGGLYRCSLKLNRTSSLALPLIWKSALLNEEIAYMLRHGTTGANVKDAFRGHEDFPLNDQGLNEAHEAAEWFLEHGVKPKRIVCSPMSRAKKTAEIVGESLGVPVEVDERLLPFDVGEFGGKVKDDVWDEFVYYLDHPDEKVPNGESVRGFAVRECAALDELFAEAAQDGPILIVVHTSNIVVADCYLRTGEPGLDCRPEEKDIVAPGGVVAVTKTMNIFPVFKDVKDEVDPDKAKHEEYDAEAQEKDNEENSVPETPSDGV